MRKNLKAEEEFLVFYTPQSCTLILTDGREGGGGGGGGKERRERERVKKVQADRETGTERQ